MLKHRNIALRSISVDDLQILFRWRNSVSFRTLCTNRRSTLSENEFRSELEQDFKNDRCEQVIILVDGIPAGTAFAYRYNAAAKHVYVSIFLDEAYRGFALGVRALALFISDIIRRFDLYKVYFETYSYNKSVVRLLSRLGLPLEGNFRGHCTLGKERFDLLTFALYPELAKRMQLMLKKIDSTHGGLLSSPLSDCVS